MFAGVVHGKDDIRYEEIQTPVPQPGEVLVRVKYTGICGSDVPRVNGNACHFFPIVLGHEFCGTITALGEGVTNRAVGQRIVGVPLLPCMTCPDCQSGNYSLCKHYSFIGSRRNGSFAQYVALPANNTIVIDDTVSDEMGALFEPATVAIHALRCVDYQPGKRVAVIGAGTVGTLAMQWCRILGAQSIVMFNHSPKKLERSLSFGADAGVDTSMPDYLDRARELTGGRGFDYVFEAAGTDETIKMAYKLVGNKGKICFIGTPKSEVVFSISEWENLNRKEMTVTGSWMSYSAPFPGSEWQDTAHYFATGDLRLEESMIFKKIPLRDIAQAFEMFKHPGQVKGKILIDCE